MVSFQTSAGTPVTQLTQQHHHPPPESSQPPDQDTSNPWVSTESLKQHSPSHTDGGARNDQPIPDALQPGFHHVPRPPIPQIQQQDTGATTTTIGSTEFDATLSGSNGSTTPFDRVPSVLRPGGKSPNSNPFRNKEGSSASHTPTDAMAKMQLDSTTTNNPWGSALSAQRTGTPASEQDAASRGQQDPWSRLDAVELDATSYAHPPTPLSLPTPPNVPPSEVPTAEERSAWAGASQHMTGTQGIVDSQNTLAARPVDEFSHIFDDKQTWDDLGRTPRIKRRATNKTAGGEDSDQDDWNMIDSEASSVAGDAEAAGLSDARKPETEAKGPSIPGVGVLPVPAANTLAATETKAQDGVAEQRPVTPYVDAPTTPWDEPKSEDVQPNNNATVGVMAGAGMETKEKSPERPPVPTIHEPKNEPKLDAPLIEPIGYEAPAQSAPLRPPKTESALLEPEEKPAVPRQAEPAQRWSPTRQPVDGKAETYRIKNIRWKDPEASESPRVSPILVQNENGPCPLVALVNALSLTTPADTSETTLVQVLRSREQISLNLVLDAVFDELMSPRRTSSEDALPDISELYEFLQSLHTGMNVNPRFIPTEQMVKAYKRSSLTHLDPTEREALMPGTFENSLEMKLYATFSIPLIHGWLPARSEPAHDAFERQAASYEDAQNLLFREEELEAKLLDPQGGLSGTEQQLYQDVMTIKMFMRESATQLTAWGIEVIGKAIRPGTFAILFRNDHFSTLYCHPVTGQLLTLVTDAGYSGHEEVVWESLEDVNGELSALYSGDFRPVGSPDSAGPSNDDGGGQWTRVRSNRRGKDRQEDDEPDMGRVPDHEQEDRDLALALQLQEEEEERQREDQERRRRESRLSEQFIEQQGRQQPQPVSRVSGRRTSGAGGGGPPLPSRTSSTVNVSVSGVGGGRRSSNSSSGTPPPQPPRPQGQTVRPLVPPATAAPVTGLRPAGRPAVHRPAEDAAASGEEAPPSYEAAQHDRRYVPGQAGQGNGGGGPPGGSMAAGGGQRPGAGIAVPSSQGPGYMYRPQRPPYGGRTSQTSGRDRDCVVM